MSWTHIEDTTPKAKKQHICILCNRPIAVGEVHVRRVGTRDGDWSSFRIHAACNQATRLWDEYDWATSDPTEFRREVLGLEE